MKTIIGMAALLALGGCQSEKKPIAEMSYSETYQLAAEINQRCIAQGVKPEDPNWKACTMQEITRENATRNRAAAKADRSMMCQRIGTMTVCD